MDTVRIGRVSSINYKKGTAKILYTDRDNSVTDDLPFLSFNDEYKMPGIGDYVLVVHLSNGQEAGYILGRFWGGENNPAVSGKGAYRKEFGSKQGEAYAEYQDGSLKIKADNIIFSSSGGNVTLAQIIDSMS